MNITGFNLLFLLLPIALFIAGIKYRKSIAGKALIAASLVAAIAMPIKLVNSPEGERSKMESSAFDRHENLPEKVTVSDGDFSEKMEAWESRLENEGSEAINKYLGE